MRSVSTSTFPLRTSGVLLQLLLNAERTVSFACSSDDRFDTLLHRVADKRKVSYEEINRA